MRTFRGLTWDHPRGFDALDAASRELVPVDADWAIHWDKQPLEGFESRPLDEIAGLYDVIVMDHPHLGEAIGKGCLRAWTDLVPPAALERIAQASVGPSYDSYLVDEKLWALPLDAATQVCASRADLIGAPPGTWEQVSSLAAEQPVALCLAGPHAALHFFSLCVALGEEPMRCGPEHVASPEIGAAALELLGSLHERSVNRDKILNPIELLETMSSTDEIGCCPLIFGYVNYSQPGARRHAVRFTDAPSIVPSGRSGSTLGGTGLALSSKKPVDERLLAHLLGLMSPECQRDFIPSHAGQPSARNAWKDECVNAAAGDFYSGTLRTMERAWVRPRYAGFVPFMYAAADAIRAGLDAGTSPERVLADVNSLFQASGAPAA
jgi:multiple sugar transport system substrate-binding protein